MRNMYILKTMSYCLLLFSKIIISSSNDIASTQGIDITLIYTISKESEIHIRRNFVKLGGIADQVTEQTVENALCDFEHVKSFSENDPVVNNWIFMNCLRRSCGLAMVTKEEFINIINND